MLPMEAVVKMVEDAFGASIGQVRKMKLEAMIRSQHGALDSPPAEGSGPFEPAAGASSAPAKSGAYGKKQAKKARQKARAVDVEQPPIVAQPKTPVFGQQARASVQNALAGFEEQSEEDDDEPEEVEAVPLPNALSAASGATPSSRTVSSVVDGLPMLSAMAAKLNSDERGDGPMAEFVAETLELLDMASSARVVVQAEQVETVLREIELHGDLSQLQAATTLRAARMAIVWASRDVRKRLAEAEQQVKRDAELAALAQAEAAKGKDVKFDLRSIASVTANAAANAAVAAATQSSGDGEANSEGDASKSMRMSEAHERVWKVANDGSALASLEGLAKAGREARQPTQKREFLKEQRQAQLDSLSLAELLHTVDLPPASGACLDELNALPEGLRLRAEERVRAVVKATGLVQEYLVAAVDACEFSQTLQYRRGGGRLAKAVLFGRLSTDALPKGEFKMTELKSSAGKGALAKESESEAKKLIECGLTSIKAAMEWLHPRDDSARYTLDLVQSKCKGESGDEAYHGEVFDVLLCEWSKMWNDFQAGTYSMPSMEETWELVKSMEEVQSVLNGTRQIRRATQEMKRANEELRKEINDLKQRKTNESRSLGDRKPLGGPHAGGGVQLGGKPPPDEHLNKVTGKERRKLALSKFNAGKAVEAAKAALASAKDANDADETAKQGAALREAEAKLANVKAELDAKA